MRPSETRPSSAAGARSAASESPKSEVHARVTTHQSGGWFASAKAVSFQEGRTVHDQVAPSSSQSDQ